jgi:enoyl-CoA hydratase
MTYDNVLLEQPEAGIFLLTVNRPKSLNALNAQTLDEIGAALAEVATAPDARVTVPISFHRGAPAERGP